MRRAIESALIHWKTKEGRKPLILLGARQTGKTFVLTHFGQTQFRQLHRIDFFTQPKMQKLFIDRLSLEPQDIVSDLEHALSASIDIHNDLLFFDEIQDCPGALASLKAFQERMPELTIVAAGSFLGIVSQESFFPVGKVEFLSLNPLSFEEFLRAHNEKLHSFYEKIDITQHTPVPHLYHSELQAEWKLFCALGGMPEVLINYLKNSATDSKTALRQARATQLQLLQGYRGDFSKHAGTINANHILHVFESIPLQLSEQHDESVRKFRFTDVIPRQKGFDRVRGPLTWLSKSRLAIKSLIANHSGHPLKGYCSENTFKLFLMDTGLLHAALDTPIEALIFDALDAYKGFMLENSIAQEVFFRTETDLISWAEGTSEIEFLITLGKDIIPIEVKSSGKSIRAKSLDAYIGRYHPPLALKLTGQNIGYDPAKKILTLPHYLVGKIWTSELV